MSRGRMSRHVEGEMTMPTVGITWLHARASVVARQYRAAVIRVAEAAGEVVGKITVEETDVRRIKRAVADMRAASERFAELRDLIDVHRKDDEADPAR
jgi:hypothetical protein